MSPGTEIVSDDTRRSRKGSGTFLSLPRILGISVAVVAVVLISLFVPRFFTVKNLFNIIVQTAPIGMMAIGITFVFITGGIDLSMPATMALSAVLGAMVETARRSTYPLNEKE